MVRKGKQRSTFYVVSFKLNEKDFKKIEQIKKICREKGLKFNKVFVFAMTKYFDLEDYKEEDPKVEQRKEQSLEKSTSTIEPNLAFHENENLKKIENLLNEQSPDLPSFFQGNPWISILAQRK